MQLTALLDWVSLSVDEASGIRRGLLVKPYKDRLALFVFAQGAGPGDRGNDASVERLGASKEGTGKVCAFARMLHDTRLDTLWPFGRRRQTDLGKRAARPRRASSLSVVDPAGLSSSLI